MLKTKDSEGKTSQEQYVIEPVNLRKITKAILIIKDVIGLAKEDENLQNLLNEFFEEAEVQYVQGGKEKKETKAEKEKKDDEFAGNLMTHLTGALDILLMEIPEKAIELMSAVSGVEYDVLMEQQADEVFDVYDAIVEVNDIAKLIARGKKSLGLTQSQLKVMNIFENKEVETIKAVPVKKQA